MLEYQEMGFLKYTTHVVFVTRGQAVAAPFFTVFFQTEKHIYR